MDPLDRGSRQGFAGDRLLIAFAMAVIAIAGYYGSRSYNPLTAGILPVRITPQQEVAIGLQAAPAMAQRYGGLSSDQPAQQRVDRICHDLVENTSARSAPYDFDCHVLADERTVDAFALPGGQVFVTSGLLKTLRTDGQLAGVLAHQIGHVVARHGAEHLGRSRLTPGLTGAAVLARYNPNSPASRRNPAVSALIGQLIDLRFSREDELDADRLGVRLMAEAGYDPRGMVQVMRALQPSGTWEPEFSSTHPSPANRVANIEGAIRQKFPRGVPAGFLL
jgi:predicted Zn-dependent protease